MTDINLLPIEDNFETTLSSPLTDDATDLVMSCDAVPTATIPVGFKIGVTLDAGTDKEEVVLVSSIDTGAVTMTITSGDRAQDLGNGLAGTLQDHSIGATVTISDSYIYWDNIKDAVNSKANTDSPTFTTYVRLPVYATTTARDAAIPTPANGMMVYVTADGVIFQYIAGAWSSMATGTTSNASTTVAGKVELATQAELNAGTDTGGTGASLVATPSQIALTAQNQKHNYFADTGSANTIVITPVPAITAYAAGQRFAIKVAANNTGATTANVSGLGAVNLYKNTSSALDSGDLLANQMIEIEHDGAQFQLMSPISNENLYPKETHVAWEALTADQAVALLPVEVEHFSQLTDVNLALGNSNTQRKRYVKWIPSKSGTMTDQKFRAAEAVNGATATGVLTFSLQTEGTPGEPSGTAVTNATATFSQATQRTWTNTMGTRTATWAGSVSYTAGTTYYYVWEVAATDGTNYINIGCNSNYDEHYLAFTTGIYNLDTGTWGSTATNACPFFWGNTETVPGGYALVPTDADFAGRAWSFEGFAATTVAAQANCDVYYDLVPTSGRVGDGKPYFLSSTVGAITQTKPGNLYDGNAASYEIGYALSATKFKIRRGEKMYFGRLTPTGSATTTHQIIPWFSPKLMRISGSFLSTANILATTVSGIYDGTSNYREAFTVTNGSAPAVELSNTTSKSFGNTIGATWEGVGSANTKVGLTYTMTKTSTPADYSALYTLTGF